MFKFCCMCKKEKPLDDFPIRKWKTNVGYGSYCKICQWQRTNNYRKKNPETIKEINRRGRLKYKYGISQADFELMYSNQNGKCLICEKKKEKLCIDHSHKTGQVRGLLCHSCNTHLGVIENEEKMKKINSYLNSWSSSSN